VPNLAPEIFIVALSRNSSLQFVGIGEVIIRQLVSSVGNATTGFCDPSGVIFFSNQIACGQLYARVRSIFIRKSASGFNFEGRLAEFLRLPAAAAAVCLGDEPRKFFIHPNKSDYVFHTRNTSSAVDPRLNKKARSNTFVEGHEFNLGSGRCFTWKRS
jgi:hypothetical protein